MINGPSEHNSVSNKGNIGDSLIWSLYNHFSRTQRQAYLKEKKGLLPVDNLSKGSFILS